MRSRESTKDVRPFRGCMPEPLLNNVNLHGRGRENSPMITMRKLGSISSFPENSAEFRRIQATGRAPAVVEEERSWARWIRLVEPFDSSISSLKSETVWQLKLWFKPPNSASGPRFGPIWARIGLNLVSLGSYFRDAQFDYKLAEIGVQVGHAGSLDPMETGLLIVCVGIATKLVGRAMKVTKSKHYATLLKRNELLLMVHLCNA
ncbi:hypothetical protein KFK09_008728 [Dendrobium nobile]|uniref:Pseudouridine synthase II N-terminal domain-containing protein n=1 Tax=Dendrobium nobile TaxID=94219 RepID=A0A8T3BQB1_DENNO|nr:hypothetical protein KFK09_008728 [Dendrobium nobile]